MDAWMRTEKRACTEAARNRPRAPHRLTFAAASDGDHGLRGGPSPTDLLIEATHPSGGIALWFDDLWWTESLQRWGQLPLAVHILPSEAALLHPVVLHEAAMVGRLAPRWRVTGNGYSSEIIGDAAVETLATSPYHEVRLLDSIRPAKASSAPLRHALRIEDLFSRVRRIERDRGATRPVLVRAKALPHVPGEGQPTKVRENEAARQKCG